MIVRSHCARHARLMGTSLIATLLGGCGQATKPPAASRAGADSLRASGTGTQMPAMPGMPDMPGMPGMQMRSDGSAMLSASAITQFGITFDSAVVRELQGTLRTVGTVAIDETGVVSVTTKVGGFIERLDARVTGQRIVRGQSLAAIYSPEILVAEEELLVAQRLGASLGRANPRESSGGSSGDSSRDVTLLSAARRRLRLLDVSDAQIDEVLRTQKVQRTTPLIAPVAGVLTQRAVTQGEAVQAGMLLFTISDLSRLWIDVRIPAATGADVRNGMLATYTVTGAPGRSFTGRIAYVYPTVGDQSRTLSARVLVRNDDGVLKPGMFATVLITSPGRRTLTVPRAAVIETGTRSMVFVDMGGGRLMPHEVDVGATTADLVEIRSGLEVGQRVVTSAQFLLESESNLADVMRSMIGMGAAAGSTDAGMPGKKMAGATRAPVKSPAPARR